jgi:hypothetical protein
MATHDSSPVDLVPPGARPQVGELLNAFFGALPSAPAVSARTYFATSSSKALQVRTTRFANV